MIFPRPRGFSSVGFSSPLTPPREASMCRPTSRARIQTVLRLTWRTSSQSWSGKFSAGVLQQSKSATSGHRRSTSRPPALDASTVDEDVDGEAEAALRLGAGDLLGQALDLLVVGQVSNDNLDVATELFDEVVSLEVLLAPLSTRTAPGQPLQGSINRRDHLPEQGERQLRPWRERAPSSGRCERELGQSERAWGKRRAAASHSPRCASAEGGLAREAEEGFNVGHADSSDYEPAFE
jgi:hypothetical protein